MIDLKRNVLVIGTTGTETPFLPENELPDCARLSGPKSEEDSSTVEMEDQELAKALQESAQAAAPPAVDPNALLPSDKFTEKQVQDLVSMGFPRSQVELLRYFLLLLIWLITYPIDRSWKN